jgi:glycerol uptake facilitator-like aquaporin
MDLRKCTAEAIGTAWLTFAGCGSAVIAAGFPQVGIGLLGVSLAFGLSVVTMAYAIGHISGCHLNPAVTIGLAVGGRFPAKDVIPYIIAQVIGAIVGAGILYLIASGTAGFDVAKGFASNGLWRPFARPLQPIRRPPDGGRHDHDVPVHPSWARRMAVRRSASRRWPSAWRWR